MIVKTRKDWEHQNDELVDALKEFSSLMRKKPFQNEGGLRGVSAFALYWFVKQAKPDVVFEVGPWRGFSTWIIQQAAPKAALYCYDPMFFLEPHLNLATIGATYRPPEAHYSGKEFSCEDIGEIAKNFTKPLVFFDDHQNKLPRLIQAKNFGIKDIIFDDNPPQPYTHRTLEHERQDPNSRKVMDRLISDYEIFPALWDIDREFDNITIKEDGLKNFPQKRKFKEIYEERMWHSYVTHVRLK